MSEKQIVFSINNIYFEYDPAKNESNIKKHGISFEIAARVFFDQDRIEMYDDENSIYEDRYNTIGSPFADDCGAIIGRMGNSIKNARCVSLVLT